MSLRTKKTEDAYRLAKYLHQLRPLNEERPIYNYKYWVVVDNRFPHDQHHVTNHCLVLRRKCDSYLKIRIRELLEIPKIYKELNMKYDKIGINTPRMISVKDFVHCHLYELKDEYK